MKSKLNELYLKSFCLHYDIIVLTETWLNESILDSEIFCSEYSIYRCDRNIKNSNCTNGGGVLIAVRASYFSQVCELPMFEDIEIICVKAFLNNKDVKVCCLYIPPNSSDSVYLRYSTAISETCKFEDDSSIFVLGDFNMPNISWSVDPEGGSFLIPSWNNVIDESSRNMIESCLLESLHQINHAKNSRDRSLDLVFVNCHEFCELKAADDALFRPSTHHIPLEVSFYIENPKRYYDLSNGQDSSWDFGHTNFNSLSQVIQMKDWSVVWKDLNVESACNTFYSTLYECVLQCVSMKTRILKAGPPWYTSELRSLRNIVSRFHRKHKNSQCNSDYLLFSKARSNFNHLNTACYKNYSIMVQHEIRSNPRKFWNFVDAKRKIKSYPTVMTYLNDSSDDASCIREMFKKFFQNVYKRPNLNSILKPNKSSSFLNFGNSTPVITESLLLSFMTKLENSSSYGPDKIPAILIKMCRNELVKPLCHILNRSLQTGIFPEIWKSSYIIPLFKAGNKCEVANYRGISKLSCIPKMFEKIVLSFIEFECKSIISPIQHGFQKGKSTASNLLEFCSDVIPKTQLGLQTDVIYLDFTKAFDRVNHSILLQKLSNYGLSNWILRWLESYLKDRVQAVMFKNVSSSSIAVYSGVPQGSHLGPLLFLLYINDIEKVVQSSKILLFADDAKLYKSYKDPSHSSLLQADLNRLGLWCIKNDMELNIKKCKTLTISRRVTPEVQTYLINSIPVDRVETFFDLGVYIDVKVNFNKHLDYIISKAMSRLGFIRRWSKEFYDPYVIKSLYCSLVRPILEYCSEVWCPRYTTHIARIESVQKQFLLYALRRLRWENRLQLPSYKSRLMLIDLTTLEKRRTISNILFMVKLLQNIISAPPLLESVMFNIQPRDTRSSEFLFIRYNRTNYGCNEPLLGMCKDYNKYFNYINFNMDIIELKKILHLVVN